MTDHAPATSAISAIEAAGLSAWLTANIAQFQGPLERVELIAGGRSNLTFALTDAIGTQYVLRRPPAGVHGGNAHDVLREARIVAGMHAAHLAVPGVLAQCEDDSIIGAPYFIMEFIRGVVLTSPGDARALASDSSQSGRLARNIVGAMSAMHAVDLEADGLDWIVRPGSYVERQLRRLAGSVAQLPESPHRAEFLRLHGLLVKQAPVASSARGVLHGDFKLGNLMLSPEHDVVAILDWELASAGEPLADVGWLLASWAQPDDGDWLVPPATADGGFPTREEMSQLYAAATGHELADIDYYVAFAFWRWSGINLGTRRRFLAGETAGTTIDIERLDRQLSWQLQRVSELIAG